ncbi:hypothetical protein BZL42_16680 [Pseudomonas indica]|nr:hypothetical protein BZL42_16680 [Pseudomonas indica]
MERTQDKCGCFRHTTYFLDDAAPDKGLKAIWESYMTDHSTPRIVESMMAKWLLRRFPVECTAKRAA